MDDLLIALKDSQSIIKTLLEVYKFKLKETGIVNYYLGYNFFMNNDGILYFAPRKHIEKIADRFKAIFEHKPNIKIHSPLEKRDHLEIDTSEFPDTKEI